MSRSIGCSHLVRVGVSWKTTESRRASGLIAEELHARTSPLLALPLLFVSDLAAKKRARRNCDKNPALCLCRMLTSPLGEKRTSRKERQKNAAPSPSGGGWMKQRGMSNQFPRTMNLDAVAINNSSAQEQCAAAAAVLRSVNGERQRESWHLLMGRK